MISPDLKAKREHGGNHISITPFLAGSHVSRAGQQSRMYQADLLGMVWVMVTHTTSEVHISTQTWWAFKKCCQRIAILIRSTPVAFTHKEPHL